MSASTSALSSEPRRYVPIPSGSDRKLARALPSGRGPTSTGLAAAELGANSERFAARRGADLLGLGVRRSALI